MFDRIWACLFAFLLSIFPSLDRYSPAMDWKAATGTVLTAIQAGDIDTIESFMCKTIKDNTTDLRGEITKMLNLIEGDITSTSTKYFDDFSMASGGKTIMQATTASRIYTSTKEYRINIIWEYYNNFSLAERGVRKITLAIARDLDVYDEHEIVFEISANTGRVHD